MENSEAMDPRLRRHPLGYLEVAEKPSESDLEEYYATKYFQSGSGSYRRSYSAEELEVIRLRVSLRAHQAEAISRWDRPGRLLDVGCGEGFVMDHFARRGWDVDGLDYSQFGVEAMNPHLSQHVQHGNVFTLLEKRIESGDRYDLVWLGNVLEHVLDPKTLLVALRHLVATGGLLIVTVPNDGSAYHEELLASGDISQRFWIAIPDHLSYFTAQSLQQIANATGWRVHDIQGDFPIDFFLANPESNYVVDQARGPAAHSARLRLERLVAVSGPEAANDFYSALARVGFGRNLTAFLGPIRGDFDNV